MAGYTSADQAYYEQVTREVQEHQSVNNLLNISQLAFRTCVHTFVHHQLTDKEEKCISAVGKKFIASSLRATARLAEAQALEVSEQRREMEARLRELKGGAT